MLVKSRSTGMMRREWQRSGGQPRYIPTSHSLKTEYVLTATNDQLLVTCLRGELPLNAEAVRKFGPMHIPIAPKGYENLFVALANRKRVDGSTLCSSEGCIRCAPKMEYLICILAQHSPKKWSEVSSCSPHAGHNGSS